MKNSPLVTKINEYQVWRAALGKTIADYRDWLATSPHNDSVKELRLHDMLETLKHDQLIITFLADEARGKTETINALFFPDLELRLFPSDLNKGSMCSTEIYWHETEEPSVKLLPISTRSTEDTLAYLKATPNVWETYKLNLDSLEEMQATLNKLTEKLEVTESEAIGLGLWDPNDKLMAESLEKTGFIKVPVWRHAVINYPHPALKSGLVIIDTPNLDKLNSEPELTLNMIPNTHAAVFLTAADSVATINDLTIWNEFIKNRTKHKFVLLNKIDVLSDKPKLKQDLVNDIDRLVNVTAHKLAASPDIVFPISAQQALSAKTSNNEQLLEESRILLFEEALGNHLVQSKHEILGKSIAAECNVMIKSSRKAIQLRRLSMEAQIAELKELKGHNINESEQILKKVIAEKKRYEASIPTFNLANEKISKLGNELLKHLSVAYLDSSIGQSRKEIGDSWTTVGLNKGIRNVMKQANELADFVTLESEKIKNLADNVYDIFHSKHGFEIFEAPDLDMSDFLSNMRELVMVTDSFCKNPINLMTEKHFLVRKFFLGLGTQKQKIFEQARKECELWLLNVLSTLKVQMSEHKSTLAERTKNLMEANDSTKALDNQLKKIEIQFAMLSKESQAIDRMLLHIVTTMQPAKKAKFVDENDLNADEPMHLKFSLPTNNNTGSTSA
ncbi:MAG: dynamin family protein [Methylophilaceae bacterium]